MDFVYHYFDGVNDLHAKLADVQSAIEPVGG